VFSLFKKNKSTTEFSPLICDVHSHLIPGIDDGVKTLDEAIETINLLMDCGYRRIITTPHIYSDMYKNDFNSISEGAQKLNSFLKSKNIDITIDFAAEYYFDHWFFNEVKTAKPLLTFGKRYLLFETNYLTEPYQLKTLVFDLVTAGYNPILAHPERYQYMTLEKADDLRTRGVSLQLNLLSITGFYGKGVQSMAQQLINHKMIDLVGSDCHNPLQAKLLGEVFSNKFYKKVVELPLLNYNL
jgi:tyrosine-protein phosphatase YwqE